MDTTILQLVLSTVDAWVTKWEKKHAIKLSSEEREKTKDALLEKFGGYIFDAVIVELSEKDVKELAFLFDQQKPLQEILHFLSTHIKEFDAFLEAVFANFEEEYLSFRMDTLEEYLDNLMVLKGIVAPTPEVKESIKQVIRDRLEEFLFIETLAQLSTDEYATVKQMLEKRRTKKELDTYISHHIEDYNGFLSDALVSFQQSFVS